MYRRLLKHFRYGNKLQERKALLRRMPRSSICAEIGVWKGDFSQEILKIVKPRELHLIDPWEFQSSHPNRMWGGKVARSQQDMDAIFHGVAERFKGSPEIQIHRGDSENVLASFQAGYFDWIYVDGNHYYDYILRDLELSWALVKRGGYVTGDDVRWRPRDASEDVEESMPVLQALNDFINQQGIDKAALTTGRTQFILQR